MGESQRPFVTTTAALVFCLFFIAVRQVKSTGTFQIQLHEFLAGGCCGRSFAVSFRICITNYQSSVELHSPCIVGETFTEPFPERELLTLGERYPPIIFPFNFTWLGSFSFVVEAYQTKMNGEKMFLSRFIAQRDLSANEDWQQEMLNSSTGPSLDISYRVKCEPNYYGNECNNHCSARDDKFGHYTCDAKEGRKICIPGWQGEYCGTAICRPGCHKLHGHCDQPFECNCRHGWEGDLCDICSRYPGCEHGTCFNAWQCICKEGWGGLFCNQDLNYCTNHRPCKNGGTCTNTGQGSYTCSCSKGFMGQNCDLLINPCDGNPCHNSGTCVLNSSESNYTCVCSLGFYGPKCETSANICISNPCLNGGSCVRASDGYSCDCMSGFFGHHCEMTVCTHHFCHNNSTCVDVKGSPHCVCPDGFYGARCKEKISCKNNPCGQGGICIQEYNYHRCSCHPGFTGVFCDVKLHYCSPNPCLNGGKCHYAGSNYRCNCKFGFTGENCTGVSDACASSPCHNGGSCKTDSLGFNCTCTHPYHGQLCEYNEVLSYELNNISEAISNTSQQVFDNVRDDKNDSTVLILVCSLSAAAIIILVSSCAIIICCKMRRKNQEKQRNETEEQTTKEGRRNNPQMNNKCGLSQSMIVNTLDRTTAKMNNEELAKVSQAQLNNRRVPEKNILQVQRTIERRHKNVGSRNSHCHGAHVWPSENSGGGVFIVQEHLQKVDDSSRHPSPLVLVDSVNVLATDV